MAEALAERLQNYNPFGGGFGFGDDLEWVFHIIVNKTRLLVGR